MKVAMTGGSGFLGYHLCNRLKDRFEEIRVLDVTDILREEYPENAVFYKTDVKNIDQIKAAIEGVDIIVHAAASLPLCSRKEIYETNIEGTKNVLESAKIYNIPRVVYVSSSAVYGVPERHPILGDR